MEEYGTAKVEENHQKCIDLRKLRGRLFDAAMDALAKVTHALPAS